jgi:two-component system OmpR family response regulator
MIMCPMPRNILIADDDPHIRQLLVFAFAKAGLDTLEAADGEAAIDLVAKHQPDLIVLDINMPRMDGLEVCRRLRADGDLPILFLSSRGDEIDRVLGIELGGDDYVVKPFSPREVVARSMAILRRAAGNPPAVETRTAIVHGRLMLDTEAWRASWAGQEIALTVTEFGILRTLATMAPASRSPTGRSTATSATCAPSSPASAVRTRSKRGRASDTGSGAVPTRRNDRSPQGTDEALLAAASPAHHPACHAAVRGRASRRRRDFPARL